MGCSVSLLVCLAVGYQYPNPNTRSIALLIGKRAGKAVARVNWQRSHHSIPQNLKVSGIVSEWYIPLDISVYL